jgi:hypothetical protein
MVHYISIAMYVAQAASRREEGSRLVVLTIRG